MYRVYDNLGYPKDSYCDGTYLANIRTGGYSLADQVLDGRTRVTSTGVP